METVGDTIQFPSEEGRLTKGSFDEPAALLARISHQLLNTAEPMSSKEAAMRARKAKPRPGGGRELGNRVSAGIRVFLAGRILILRSLGAVLPQSGYHLPRSLVRYPD